MRVRNSECGRDKWGNRSEPGEHGAWAEIYKGASPLLLLLFASHFVRQPPPSPRSLHVPPVSSPNPMVRPQYMKRVRSHLRAESSAAAVMEILGCGGNGGIFGSDWATAVPPGD